MNIPFTLGISTVSIFKLSKESQREGHREESQMDKGQEKKKKKKKKCKKPPKQIYRSQNRKLPSTNTQETFTSFEVQLGVCLL